MSGEFHICFLESIKELKDVEELQRFIWRMPERDVVPFRFLKALIAGGGAVVGARTKTGKLIGFAFGFPGLRDGERIFYSHQTGVHPDFQNSGVGFLLKKTQREYALSLGIDRILWTFDPLRSLNAYFNFHKLGVVASRYLVNYYGVMRDALNRGMGSDRLEVDWWIKSPEVEQRMQGISPPSHLVEPLSFVLMCSYQKGYPLPGKIRLGSIASPILVEIPLDIQALRDRQISAVKKWRIAVRKVFLHYFSLGYEAVDFLKMPYKGKNRYFYVLKKK
ncbi:MAG: GNAT family N-acetyltransferase [bacterium JZ-2024 1]